MFCSRLTTGVFTPFLRLSKGSLKPHFGQARSVISLSSSRGFCGSEQKKTESVALVVIPNAVKSLCPQSREIKPVSVKPQVFPKWVTMCFRRHPEFLWFVDSSPISRRVDSLSYSQQLFGHICIELDKLLHSMYCVQLVLRGDENAYLEFTAGQSDSHRLSRQSFLTLSIMGKRLFRDASKFIPEAEIIHAIETALILQSIGNSGKAREIFRSYGITSANNVVFCKEVIRVLFEHSNLLPSFHALSLETMRLVVLAANLPVEVLATEERETSIHVLLYFDLFVKICGMIGVVDGHRTMSLYNEQVHEALDRMRNSARVFSEQYCAQIRSQQNYVEDSRIHFNGEESSTEISHPT